MVKFPFMKARIGTPRAAIASGSETTTKKVKKDRFSRYFEGKGLTVTDLPKAIVCHELMGIFMLALTWSTCYFFPLSQNQYLKEPIARMVAMVPKALSGTVTSNPFLSSRIGTSYLESSCLRKLIRPITLPSKLYLTYQLVQVLPNFHLIGQKGRGNTAPLASIKGASETQASEGGSKTGNVVRKKSLEATKISSLQSLRGGATGSRRQPQAQQSDVLDMSYNSYSDVFSVASRVGEERESAACEEFGYSARISRSCGVGKIPHYFQL
jgi:hypothetical protein